MTTQIKAGVIAANAITASELASSALSGGSFTGDVTFDTNTLVIDSTNNRVGIGTSSPGVLLDVSGATATIRAIGTSASNPSLTLSSAGITAWSQTVSGSDSSLSFNKDGSEKMRIDTSGNVGIGTSSPTAPLNIFATYSSDTTEQFRIQDNTGGKLDFFGYANGGKGLQAYADNGSTFYNLNLQPLGGNVGIGTSSPGTKLHVTGTVGAFHSNNDNRILMYNNGTVGSINVTYGTIGPYLPLTFLTGDTERIRINTNGTVGIGSGSRTDQMLMVQGAAPQIELINTSNSYGSLTFVNNTNTSSHNDIASIGAEIDSGNAKGRIVFKTRNTDASGSQAERMRIESSGDIRFGISNAAITANECYTFANRQEGNNIALYTQGNASFYSAVMWNTVGGSCNQVLFLSGGSGTAVGSITSTGNTATQYNTSSDYRLKENIQPLANGLERLQQLNPIQFDWKSSGETSEGFIAHEVQEVFPEAVSGEKDGEDMQGMDYGRITPLLVKAIQEQQTIIDALQARLDAAGI